MSAAPWYREFFLRIRSLFVLKTLGITAFITLFFITYLHLLRHPAYPITPMPLTAVDHMIGFQPFALSIYLTLWFYVTLPPALLHRPAELYRYGLAIAAVCGAGLICFLFWPTAVPYPAMDWQGYPGSEILKGVDAAGNACPSLHVATAAFSGLWLHRLLKEMGASAGPQAINLAWCAAIIYSTLAIKQHVFLDALAGLLLGLIGAAWSIWWLKPLSARENSLKATPAPASSLDIPIPRA